MGKSLSRLAARLCFPSQLNILMIGMPNAGKTSILYKLKLGEIIVTIPTIGFNVQTLNTPIAKFTIWDVGGGCKIRLLWKHYFSGRDLIIFVIDGSDQQLFEESRYEILRLDQQTQLQDVPFLIISAKSDLPGYIDNQLVIQKLKLNTLKHVWKLISFSIHSPDYQISKLLEQSYALCLSNKKTAKQ